MCRYAAYLGPPLLLSEMLYRPPNSLVHQSKDAMRSLTRINADGFGVGWYAPEVTNEPAVFKDTSPLWNNYNLGSLADKIVSPAIVAHVRAARRFDPVTRENCHPFQRGRLLWMHNGDIPGRAHFTRLVTMEADDALLAQIRGNTDSEFAFTLFLTYLAQPLNREVSAAELAEAMDRTVAQIASWHLDSGDRRPLELNFCVCTGTMLVATRFALTDDDAPSLHWREGAGDSSERFVCVASEPLSEENGWRPIENGRMLVVDPSLVVSERRLAAEERLKGSAPAGAVSERGA